MTRVFCCGSLIGGLMLGLACRPEQPTAPSAVRDAPAITEPPTQPPQRLPLGKPVATYVFSGLLDYSIHGFTTGSQYLLSHENGVFGLRYDAFAHVYLGTYQQDNATITFRFDGEWTWNQGIATGTLKGELLRGPLQRDHAAFRFRERRVQTR